MLTALLLLIACADKPTVVIESTRDGHFLDRPFPSDELLDSEGRLVLDDFPLPESDLGQTLVGGWATSAQASVYGFSHLAPVYVRLSAPIEVEPTYEATDDAPIRLLSLDSEHRVPVRTRFIADPAGDPFYAPNTLAVAPQPSHPLRSGERYALVLDRSLVAVSDDLPAELDDEPRVAFATTFTVQDSLGQLQQLRDATLAELDAHPEYLQPTALREVVSLDFAPDQTPSGRNATRCTVTYASGETEVTWLAPRTEPDTFTVDLATDAMQVFEARIQTIAWRPLNELPYASPGIGFLTDFGRTDGHIHFAADGSLLATPEPEAMRIVLQVPRDAEATALFTWDHGTGGQAYSAVQHPSAARRSDDLRHAAAAAGVAILSRDQPLYGQRYPLIDEGFDGSLGFYNIANLPAFRDNQRQGAVDHWVLTAFARDVLPGLDLGVQPTRIGAFGHSLGSVTNHIALAGAEGDDAELAFMSGSGGYLANYVVNTGLLGSDNDVVELLEAFVDADLPPDANGSEAVGALIGVPEEGWALVDDMHPVFALFQTIMDPSDPLALAPHQPVPEQFLVGIGDDQVPNLTTEWLLDALPDAARADCHPLSDYDPHHCTFVEDEGIDAVSAWIESLP